MKFQRQNLILKLIDENEIETQKELSDLLVKAGFDVTQATVSRDIKELRIVKVLGENQKYHYVAAASDGMNDFVARFRNIFRESVVNVDCAGNIVVIKTLTGVASAAGAAVDAMGVSNIVGSVAGDDTIFLLIRTPEKAAELCQDIKEMLK
ncbi:MAG: arginine repressor [Clostridia bacterium]|nr:arginine repressor [Clostridia bacterium]